MKLNEDNLETGDILLFSDKKDFHSILIEKITNSKYSHVAMVLKNPTYINSELKGIYIIESSYENCVDAIDHKYKYGVQIQKLDDILIGFEGEVYIRKLHCNKDNHFYTDLNIIYKDIKDIPYDLNPFDWIKASLHLDIGNTHKINKFWCSALISYIYVRLNLLPMSIPWTLVTPCELSSTGDIDNLFINCTLGVDELIYSTLKSNKSTNK